MKTKFNFISVLILYVIGQIFFTTPNLLAQSGWRDSSYFKIQKQKIDNLKNAKLLTYTYEAYYTLDDNNHLIRWNLNTGEIESDQILHLPKDYDYISIGQNLSKYAVAKLSADLQYYDIYLYDIYADSAYRHFQTNSKFRNDKVQGFYMYLDDSYHSRLITSVHFDSTISDSKIRYGINEDWGLLPDNGKYIDSNYFANGAIRNIYLYDPEYFIDIVHDTTNSSTNQINGENQIILKSSSGDYYTSILQNKYQIGGLSPYGERYNAISYILNPMQYKRIFAYTNNGVNLIDCYYNNNNRVSPFPYKCQNLILYDEYSFLGENVPNTSDSNLTIYKIESATLKIIDSIKFDFPGKIIGRIFNSTNILISANDGYVRQLNVEQALSKMAYSWSDSSNCKIHSAKLNNVDYFNLEYSTYYTLNDTNKYCEWDVATGLKKYETLLNLPKDYDHIKISSSDNKYAIAKLSNDKLYYDIFVYQYRTNQLVRHIQTEPNTSGLKPTGLFMDINWELLTSVYYESANDSQKVQCGVNNIWGLYEDSGKFQDSSIPHSKMYKNIYNLDYATITEFFSKVTTESPYLETENYDIIMNQSYQDSTKTILSNKFVKSSNGNTGIQYSNFSSFSTYYDKLVFFGYTNSQSNVSTEIFEYNLSNYTLAKAAIKSKLYMPIVYDNYTLLAQNSVSNANLTIYKIDLASHSIIDSMKFNFGGQIHRLETSDSLIINCNDGKIRMIDIYSTLINKDNGWINNGITKAQSAKIENQKYFKISADGKAYFTLTNTNILTKWNMGTGLKDYEKILNLPSVYAGFTISNLDEHYAFGVEAGKGYCKVELHKIEDTTLVKSFSTYNPKYEIYNDFWVGSSDLYIYIDDESDSIITSNNYQCGSNHDAFYTGIKEIRGFHQDTSFWYGPEINYPINNILQSPKTKKCLMKTYSGNSYDDGWVSENSSEGQLYISNNLSNSFRQIYSNGYFSRSSSSGNEFSGEGCSLQSFTFNSDESKLAFDIGTSKNYLGLINFNSTDSITRMEPNVKLDGLLYVKDDYLLTSNSDYKSDTGTFYLLNSTDGQAFDSLSIRNNEMGAFHPIPNSDKIFIQSNDGRYRIIDLMPNIIHNEINFTCGKRIQMLQDTFKFNPILPAKYDSLLWDFGDGSYSRELSPKHKYSQNGNYNLRLTVYNNNKYFHIKKDDFVKVIELPNSSFTTQNIRGIAPYKVHIENTSTGNYEASQWYIDNALTATTKDLDAIIKYPGTYSIRLISNIAHYSDTLDKYCIINVLTDLTPVIPSIYENEMHYFYDNNSFYMNSEIDTNIFLLNLNNKYTFIDSSGYLIKQLPFAGCYYKPYKPGYIFSTTPIQLTDKSNEYAFFDKYLNPRYKDTLSPNNFLYSTIQFSDKEIRVQTTINSIILQEIINNKATDNKIKILCGNDYESWYENFDFFRQDGDENIYLIRSARNHITIAMSDTNLHEFKAKENDLDIASYEYYNYSIKILKANKESITFACIKDNIASIYEMKFFNGDPVLENSIELGIDVKNIIRINDRLLIIGSKTNMPILQIRDLNLNIISENIWTDRRGFFEEIIKTYDNGIFLSGVSANYDIEYETGKKFAHYLKLSEKFYKSSSEVRNNDISTENSSILFPNPANGITNLQVNTEVGTELNISIYDLQGREIHKIFSGRSDSKQLNLMFDAKKYCPNAGAYFIQIERNGQIETVNMIVE